MVQPIMFLIAVVVTIRILELEPGLLYFSIGVLSTTLFTKINQARLKLIWSLTPSGLTISYFINLK